MFLDTKASRSFKQAVNLPLYRELGKENIMKRNTGIITRVTIGSSTFECDGYVKYDVLQSLLTWQEINALTFTDFLGSSEPVLSESTFMENEDGETFEVEIDECDPEEHRTFDNCLKLSKAIKNFVAKGV